mmetsp:Transcript_53469/g.121916  ORF Transcript_53469/g.121916 Transcript_53469/m.121916 type:complete len:214 (+) Transcript_53469:347-988(+)
MSGTSSARRSPPLALWSSDPKATAASQPPCPILSPCTEGASRVASTSRSTSKSARAAGLAAASSPRVTEEWEAEEALLRTKSSTLSSLPISELVKLPSPHSGLSARTWIASSEERSRASSGGRMRKACLKAATHESSRPAIGALRRLAKSMSRCRAICSSNGSNSRTTPLSQDRKHFHDHTTVEMKCSASTPWAPRSAPWAPPGDACSPGEGL